MSFAVLLTTTCIFAAACGTVLYKRKIRPKFSVNVNCWFCNKDTVVPYGNRNCWDCPSCEQYNGFREDGDYNKSIPAQHEESLNHPLSATSHNNKNGHTSDNGLCKRCNDMQYLKIKAVADFVPQNHDNVDAEIEIYRQSLENSYKLCRHCEAVLRQTLGQQDSQLRLKLLSWKLQRSSRGNVHFASVIKNTKKKFKAAAALRLLTLLMVLALMLVSVHHLAVDSRRLRVLNMVPEIINQICLPLYHFSHAISIVGFAIFVNAVALSRPCVQVADSVCCLLWTVLLTLQYSPPSMLHLTQEDINILKPIASSIVFISIGFGLFNFRPETLGLCVSRVSDSCSEYSNDSRTKSMETHSYISSKHLQDCTVTSSGNYPRSSPIVSHPDHLNNFLGAMRIGHAPKASSHLGIFRLQDYTPMQLFPACQQNTQSLFTPTDHMHYRRPILTPPRLQPKPASHDSYWNLPSLRSRRNSDDGNGRLGLRLDTKPLIAEAQNQSTSPTFGSRMLLQDKYSLDRTSSYIFADCLQKKKHFFSPSLCSRENSKAGSVYGDDQGSVYSEPPYQTNSAYNKPSDHSTNSSHSSIATNHVLVAATATNSLINRISWESLALCISITANIICLLAAFHTRESWLPLIISAW